MENGWIECFGGAHCMNVSTHSANNRSRVAYRKSSQISLLHQFQNVTRDDRDFNFHFNIKHASKAWWNFFSEPLQFSEYDSFVNYPSYATIKNKRSTMKSRSDSIAKVVCHYCTGMTALIVKILARVGKRVILYISYIIYACRG